MNFDTRYYDALAQGYNELYKEEQTQKIHPIIQHLEQEKLPVDMPILDYGCGTGFSLDMIAQALKRSCVGIDPSPKMIAQYKGKQPIQQLHTHELPFSDEEFCATISITALHHTQQLTLTISELRRVTKKDGPIIISSLANSKQTILIAEELAEQLVVENLLQTHKDIIFFCRRI